MAQISTRSARLNCAGIFGVAIVAAPRGLRRRLRIGMAAHVGLSARHVGDQLKVVELQPAASRFVVRQSFKVERLPLVFQTSRHLQLVGKSSLRILTNRRSSDATCSLRLVAERRRPENESKLRPRPLKSCLTDVRLPAFPNLGSSMNTTEYLCAVGYRDETISRENHVYIK